MPRTGRQNMTEEEGQAALREQYGVHGFNFKDRLDAEALRSLCEKLGIVVDSYVKAKPIKADWLWYVERHFAMLRVKHNQHNYDYLAPTFNIGSHTTSFIRQILTLHDIRYLDDSKQTPLGDATLPQLQKVFADNIDRMREQAGYSSQPLAPPTDFAAMAAGLSGLSVGAGSGSGAPQRQLALHHQQRPQHAWQEWPGIAGAPAGSASTYSQPHFATPEATQGTNWSQASEGSRYQRKPSTGAQPSLASQQLGRQPSLTPSLLQHHESGHAGQGASRQTRAFAAEPNPAQFGMGRHPSVASWSGNFRPFQPIAPVPEAVGRHASVASWSGNFRPLQPIAPAPEAASIEEVPLTAASFQPGFRRDDPPSGVAAENVLHPKKIRALCAKATKMMELVMDHIVRSSLVEALQIILDFREELDQDLQDDLAGPAPALSAEMQMTYNLARDQVFQMCNTVQKATGAIFHQIKGSDLHAAIGNIDRLFYFVRGALP